MSSPSSGYRLMPMLADSCSTCPPTRHGSAMAAISLPAISSASDGCDTSVSRIRNSSPPWRLTVSASRTADDRRCATVFSTSSPSAWPSVSLIGLKLSRSRNSSARRLPRRLALAIACAQRSSSSARLGSCVSGSSSAERDSGLQCLRGGLGLGLVAQRRQHQLLVGFEHRSRRVAAELAFRHDQVLQQAHQQRARRVHLLLHRASSRSRRCGVPGFGSRVSFTARGSSVESQASVGRVQRAGPLVAALARRPAAEQAFLVGQHLRRCGCRLRRC